MKKDTIETVSLLAREHINKFIDLANRGEVTWMHMDTPRPGAMRSFVGNAKDYYANVVQANVVDKGVVHHGVLVVTSGDALVINVPPFDAEYLFHRAQGQSN